MEIKVNNVTVDPVFKNAENQAKQENKLADRVCTAVNLAKVFGMEASDTPLTVKGVEHLDTVGKLSEAAKKTADVRVKMPNIPL